MAFDDKTRIRLQNFVSEARNLLTEEFTRQLQNEYGLDPTTGEVSDIDSLAFLDDARRQTARLLRDILNHYQASNPSSEIRESLERIVREQAFTVLNRLCALRMAEARDILIESISNGYNSKGFQLYARVAGTALGETGDAYRNYLFSIFDEFAMDLPVLFDRYSPMGRLFPRESVLLELLEKINNIEINPLWTEDETIGWMYQYFNSAEERRQMRNESQAPRNSRELAVRNQFFTPRYVVEFLTDNTLGRIWYEMTKGNTALKDTCRYLVRRPNEIFLARGEDAPEQEEVTEDLSQQELLSQPVYIPFRPLKDPREIRMLDPACGSMHFGLYAFDLFEQIYKEAWELESRLGDDLFERSGEFKPLIESYEGQETFLRDIPRLIIEHNIHGVDIDPRAVQIAGLSLWLRAQRSWKDQNIKQLDRPQIRKSNIVCAEPMPGEKDLLQDFTKNLKPRVLGQLVEIIFEKMELAGEAGSLLKIEEEIEDAIEKAREGFNKELLRRKQAKMSLFPELEKPKQTSLFDFTDLPDRTEFWLTAEQKILNALRNYAEQAETKDGSRRQLFVKDAARGFAFIDLCRKHYDVVLMNPPFGEFSEQWKAKARATYPNSYNDILGAFVERHLHCLVPHGRIGAITSRTCFF
nr:SAM-dependent methyltransferase [Bacteroidota bacterium]